MFKGRQSPCPPLLAHHERQAQSFSLRPPQLGTGEGAAQGGAGRVMGKEGPETVAWGEP